MILDSIVSQYRVVFFFFSVLLDCHTLGIQVAKYFSHVTSMIKGVGHISIEQAAGERQQDESCECVCVSGGAWRSAMRGKV